MIYNSLLQGRNFYTLYFKLCHLFFPMFNTSQSRGVAIFINSNFDCKADNLQRDDRGNLLILNCKICEI